MKIDFLKKNVLIYAFIFALGAFSFVFGHNVWATEAIDQQYSGSTGYSTVGQLIGQRFTPTASNISSVSVYIAKASSTLPCNYYFYICQGIPDATAFATQYDCSGNGHYQVFSSVNSNWVSATGWINFPMATPKTIYPGTTYYWSLKEDTANCKILYGGGGGGILGFDNGVTPPVYYPYWSTNYKTYYDTTFSSYDLQIDDPDPYLVYKDFPGFNLHYQISTTSPIFVGVKYGLAGSQTLVYNDYLYFASSTGYIDVQISKSHKWADGVYYYQAYLQNATGTIFATTTTYWLDIDNKNGASNFTGLYVRPAGTIIGGNTMHKSESELCGDLATSTLIGEIECSFRKVIDWAFVPNAITVDDLKHSASTTQQQFPFSLVYDITNTVQSAVASSTTNMNGSFSVPVPKMTSSGTAGILWVSAINSTTIPAVIGSTNSNIVRTTISYVIWTVACIGLFLLVKKIW